MAVQQWEKTRYGEDLLKKPRGEWDPFGDLLARYAITLPATDAEIAARVMEVRAYWREIAGRRGSVLAQVVEIFLAADAELERKHGSEMVTAQWWEGQYWRTQSASVAERLDVPVSIYLTDETIHRQVETAVDQWLITADVSVDTRADPVIGSWFRRIKASAKRAIRTPVGREALLTALHVADSHLVQAQGAYVTSTLLQNVGPVLLALQPTKDAVVRAGALLIVKVDWVVQVHQLTAAQQAILDHRPLLAASPTEIVTALQLIESDSHDDALP